MYPSSDIRGSWSSRVSSGSALDLGDVAATLASKQGDNTFACTSVALVSFGLEAGLAHRFAEEVPVAAFCGAFAAGAADSLGRNNAQLCDRTAVTRRSASLTSCLTFREVVAVHLLTPSLCMPLTVFNELVPFTGRQPGSTSSSSGSSAAACSRASASRKASTVKIAPVPLSFSKLASSTTQTFRTRLMTTSSLSSSVVMSNKDNDVFAYCFTALSMAEVTALYCPRLTADTSEPMRCTNTCLMRFKRPTPTLKRRRPNMTRPRFSKPHWHISSTTPAPPPINGNSLGSGPRRTQFQRPRFSRCATALSASRPVVYRVDARKPGTRPRRAWADALSDSLPPSVPWAPLLPFADMPSVRLGARLSPPRSCSLASWS
mmetsp:Transcript_105824/g.306120  ORF Transcript_105824/g.306120 Transcript_105824/m.306120 type:complete len:375 (-) Transcript_105824:29-1153(-)